VLEPERRQVPRAHDDVRLEVVDLADRALQQARDEVLPAAVEVREVGDGEGRGVDAGKSRSSGRIATFRVVPAQQPAFRAFAGTDPPKFVNQVELECARMLDYYGVRWEYEPTTFVLERDEDGRVTSAFTPDFYLPEQNLYVEVTVMRQSLVTRKNRKLRELKRLYPDVKVKLFYRRDIERLAQRLRLKLAT
jgi:hypoxanthine phosphoribosyltransferase